MKNEDTAKRSALRPRRWLKRTAMGCVVTFFVLAIVCGGVVVYLVQPDFDLAALPQNTPYASTRFVFRYGHETRIVDDEWNQLRYIFGDLPDSITVDDGLRLIVYDSPKSIIKSSVDSIDVQYDTLHHKGYMGIWSDEILFAVDGNGWVHLASEWYDGGDTFPYDDLLPHAAHENGG